VFACRAVYSSHCKGELLFGTALEAHLRTQSGEKPYSCSQCQKYFAHLSGWQVHLRIHFWGETLQLIPVFKVVYYVIRVASTFKNSFWRETLQLVMVFTVVYYVIWFASPFNLFWGEILQLLTVFKVIYCISSGLQAHLIYSGEKSYSCSQCSKLFTVCHLG
jgi:KRAB domain-containing zinc finger protein